jgi:cytochrome P450
MKPINAIRAATHAAPYPYYAELLSGPPLIFDEQLGMWLAARASVVAEVLSHPECRVRPAAEAVPKALAGSPVGGIFAQLVRRNDGAKHTQPKLALARALAGLDHGRIDASVRRATKLLASACNLQDARALDAWTHSLPIFAVGTLLGFDDAALPKLDAWMKAFVASMSPLGTPAQVAEGARAAQALLESFRALASGSEGTQGTLLDLVQREVQAVSWNESNAIFANLIGLLSQTYDATAGLIGNSVVALHTQPGLDETTCIASLVQEVSRFDPPVQNTRRFVAQPVSIAGTELAAGDTILLVLAAANRDPEANSRPNEFLLDREERRMFTFGHGVHACPGQSLALSIATGAVGALIEQNRPVTSERAISWTYRPSLNGRIPLFADQRGKELP